MAAFGAVALPLGLWVAPVGAAVKPVGAVSLKLSVTLTEDISGTPTPIGPITGTATGTVDSKGHLNFPAANIKFNSVTQTVLVLATLHPIVTGDWTGAIDPTSGTVALTGDSIVHFSVTSPYIPDCPIGPSTWHLFGKGYNPKTGKVTVKDPSFAIPAVPFETDGCGGDTLIATINSSVGLPGSGAASAVLTFSPKITGTGVVPTTTTTTTTTTVAPPTTATPITPAAVDPGNTTGQLPRTGSSTMPLAFAGGTFVLAGLALAVRRKPRTVE